MDDSSFCKNLVNDICSCCEDIVRDQIARTIDIASEKSGKSTVALAVAVASNVGDPVCHTHIPCTILVTGCAYCAKYGNEFAPRVHA